MSDAARLPANAHIGYAHLRVQHLPRSLAFYADAIGLHEIGRSGPTSTLSADGATPHLLLTEDADAPAREPRTIGLYHTAIRVSSRVMLANLFRRLVLRDIPFQGFSDHLVSEALYLPDPDGNGVELYRDRPRAEWPVRDGLPTMDTLPLNVEALLDDADDRRWSGIDPAADIGHMHLHVSDLDASEAFYCGVLGFDVIVRAFSSALFISAGGYHHHVGLNTWAGTRRPPSGSIGLIEFSIVVPGAEDFQAAADRLSAAGFEADGSAAVLTAESPDGQGIVVTR
jgi:catechol 2,3-dioxygenase